MEGEIKNLNQNSYSEKNKLLEQVKNLQLESENLAK